jgi:VanZ family protein
VISPSLTRVWWGLGVLIVLVALVVCLVPGHELPGVRMNDKVAHIAGHCLMAVYFAGLVPRGRWWKIFVFLMVFGVFVEFAQFYMNVGRDGDPRDAMGNCLGAFLGLLLARLGLARWPLVAAWLLGQRRAVE